MDQVHSADWKFIWFILRRTTLIEGQDQTKIRALGDGFGQTTDPDLLFDWSHVRDSSDQAVTAMAAATMANKPDSKGSQKN